MAGSSGQTPNHIIEELEKKPFSFDFFRALRLLQTQFPNHERIGYSLSPADDPVRFGQNPSLSFAPSTIEALRHSPAAAAPKLFVRHFGLFGPHGPMPLHFTEYAYERQVQSKDFTIAAFLNVFHHRLISFFFRAWADSQKTVDLDRPEDQHFAVFLGTFFGFGTDAMRERDEVQDAAKLYFTGRMANQTRHAEGLECILREYFEIKTELQTFVGRWMNLPADSLCQLGASPETGRLGLTTIVGSRIWEAQLNFRIRMGPMKLADYQRLLPSGVAFKRLKRWVLNYCGEHFFWDVQLVLLAAEVPDTRLGQSGLLGWTTWLKTKPLSRDADDLILNPPND
jgi:type VI secretion system protein ImpH